MNANQSTFKQKAHKPLIITLVVFVFGACLVADVPNYINGIQAQNWNKVEGTFLSRDTQAVKVGSSTVLKMKLKYQYVANGSVIFGHRLRFQEKPAFNGLEIAELEKKYKLGDKVTVFYNPSNPRQSCIEPGANLMDVLSHLVIYVIFAVIVYLSAYPQLYKFKSEKAELYKLGSNIDQNNTAAAKE